MKSMEGSLVPSEVTRARLGILSSHSVVSRPICSTTFVSQFLHENGKQETSRGDTSVYNPLNDPS